MDRQETTAITAIEQRTPLVLKDIVRHLPLEHDSEEKSFSFQDPQSERTFEIRTVWHVVEAGLERERFFMSELIPNGRMCTEGTNGEGVHCWDEPRIREFETRFGPNALIAELRKADIETSALVLTGGGFGINSRYHPNLEACAREIAVALLSDTRYEYMVQPTEQDRLRQATEQARSSREFWLAEQQTQAQAHATTQGLFKGCTNLLGMELDAVSKDAILHYLNAPSQEKWLEIRGILVAGPRSLWAAWCQFETTAPSAGDTGYPEPETLRTAIRAAVEHREEEIRNRLARTNGTHLTLI